ncbi:MAG: S-layer homology domain-containing protein [Anaerovoracaceae bacterium]|jgi:hypothetical protein
MRKVLSFVLVLSLVLGSFSMAFGAGATSDYPDVKDTNAEGAVAVLSALGVINGYPDGTFKPEKTVTRAEMAKLIVVALGMDNYVEGMYPTFPDAKGNWAQNFIAWCASYGIIEGFPDGTFKPNNTVTLQQAVTMVVRALGYQDQYLTGTWPTSHISMAMSLDILDDIVATTAGASRGDVAKMLYNALSCSLINYDSAGNLAVTGDSMLKRLGAYEFEQVIDRDNVIDAAIDINDYLGAYAKFWAIDADKDKETGITDYRTFDKDDNPVDTKYECIVAVEDQISTFLTGDYTPGGKAKFEVGDKTYEFKNNANGSGNIANWFYNGDVSGYDNDDDVYYTEEDWASSDGDTFTVAAKVSGNYITKIYSVLEWEATEEVQWDNDYAEELADDQSIEDCEFVLNDNDEIDTKTFALRGAESLDKIKNDDVVTVYVSDFDEVTKVEVGTKTVDGKITKVNKAGDKFTIDGKEYAMSGKATLALEVGTEGVFFLNYNGEIAFLDEQTYAGNYAVVLAQGNEDTSYGSGSVYKLHLLTKDDEQEVYSFSKNATGTAFIAAGNTNADVTTNYPARTNTVGALIEIKTNAAGKLVAATAPGDAKYVENKKLSSKNLFDGRPVLKDAVVFVVPSFDTATDFSGASPNRSFKDTDDCYVTTLGDITTDDEIDAIYATNKDGKINALVVTKDAVGSSDMIGWLTGYSLVLDSDDNTVYALDVLVNGKAESYETDILAPDASVTNAAAAKTTPVKFVLTGDTITKIENITITEATAPLDKFVGTDALTYKGLPAQPADFATGGMKFFEILKKTDDSVDVGTAGTPEFQYIGDAKYIRLKIKDNGSFDKMVVGKASDVKAGVVAALVQLDADTEAWDTVVYMTANDYEDLNP